MPSLPRPGQVVQVTFTGTVDDDGSELGDDYFLTNAIRFTDGTVIAAGDDPIFFEVVTEPYTPKLGDVATYKTGAGAAVTIQYRVGPDHSGRARGGTRNGWFNEYNAPVTEPETDSTFRLLVRDGQPVSEASN